MVAHGVAGRSDIGNGTGHRNQQIRPGIGVPPTQTGYFESEEKFPKVLGFGLVHGK